MNLILSIILCFAMAVGGSSQLSAEPESMGVYTVSNVSIGYGSEIVELDKEAVLQGAISEQDAQLHFKINSGDQVMLPLAAKISSEELLVSLNAGGRAYSFSDEDLMESGEIVLTINENEDEENLALLDDLAELLMNVGRLLGKMHDPEYAQRVSDWSASIDEKLMDDPTVVEVEIDGAIYPAEYRSGTYNEVQRLEAMGNTEIVDIPELKAVIEGVESLLCLSEGVDAEKGFAGLAERFAVEADELPEVRMEMTFMEQEGLQYQKVDQTTTDEKNKLASSNSVETISRPESIAANIQSRMVQDKAVLALDLRGQGTGSAGVISGFDLEGEIRIFDDRSRPVEFGDEGEEYLDTEETILKLNMHADCVEGLWSAELDVDGEVVAESGSVSDKYRQQEPFTLHFSYAEKEAAEGKECASYAMELPVGSDVLRLSFDVAHESQPYTDPFNQMQVYEIRLNEENAAAQMMMMSDVMAMSGNAMLLSAQEDIIAAADLLESINLYGEYVEVKNVEEAEKHFHAPIPAFTPFEGYELDRIEAAVDGSCVDFYYWSEAKSDAMVVSYYDFRGKAKYNGIDEEKLEKGPVIHTDVMNGLVYYIDVYTPDVNIFFTVNGLRTEEVDSLLERLDIASVYMDAEELAALREAGQRPL